MGYGQDYPDAQATPPDPRPRDARDEAAEAAAAAQLPAPAPGEEGGDKRSAAAVLVDMAVERYELATTPEGAPYALPRHGDGRSARVVRELRGGGASLRAELAAAYRRATGRVAGGQALADALLAAEGIAAEAEPVQAHLRVAEHAATVYLDLGDHEESVVAIGAGRWSLARGSVPVRFRRTKLTGALPIPVRARRRGLDALWAAVNVPELDRPLVAAWLVAALIAPGIPHPALALFAEQGSGKSTTSRALVSLVDPSPVPLRKPPRDADGWVTAAAGSWVVGLDNLSTVPEWLSDSLCRAVTGDGDVRRALYTDGGLAVFAFRRVILLNGIDVGALRGDLAERLLTVRLPRIDPSGRRREADVAADFEAARPAIFAALLDLAAGVHHALPSVHLGTAPRMADFAAVLAAVDQTLGTDGLTRYGQQAATIAADTLGADPLLAALSARTTALAGTASQLLATLTPAEDGWRAPRGWPTNARAVTTALRRNAPALRTAGWSVEDDEGANKAGTITWTLTPPRPAASTSRDGARNPSPPDPPDPPPQQTGRSSDDHGGSRRVIPAPPSPAVTRQDHGEIGPSTGVAGQAGMAGHDLTLHLVAPPTGDDHDQHSPHAAPGGPACQRCAGPISRDRAAYGHTTCRTCAASA